jgi:BirA family biotin operon repressor/biotin-[acetyl-CoA-carboxylase] ligase
MEKFKTISSTNQKAKELAQNGAGPWTVIVAEKQTQGRGKKKSPWYSPLGGLYFSVILPKSNIEDLQTLTILAAFIVTKTLKENFGLEPLIKLPNDVLLHGKKIAGILTENVVGREVRSSVMGIGLNTNIESFPRELEKTSTSLKMELGRKIDNNLILGEILKGLKEQLKTISQ